MSSAWRRLLGLAIVAVSVAIPMMRVADRPVDTLITPWGAPPSQFMDLQGQLVHYRDQGPRDDPEPLVLLHGTSASLHTWDGWTRVLMRQRRVIRIDLPGFGLTGPWTGAYAGRPYQGDSYARFVFDMLDQLAVPKMVVAGNSLGGEVAWRMAVSSPSRVTRLVLVDPAGLSDAGGEFPLAWRLLRMPYVGALAQSLITRGLVRQGLVRAVADPARISDEQVERYYYLALREGNREALRQALLAHEPGTGVAHVTGVTQPTLLLWGAQDRLIPVANARRFAADIAGSQLVVFDELGHIPQEEDPLRSLAPVKTFLGLPP